MKVELTQWTKEYKEDLIRICNGADRSYFTNRLPYPYTEQDADWWLNMIKEQEGKSGIFRAILVEGKAVGNITIEQKGDVYCQDADIGYMLETDLWSHGIMTEAVRQICEIGFNKLHIIRITGLVYAPNTASRKVLEKNHFTLEGMLKNAVTKGDQVYDMCVYGKLKG